MAMWSDDAVSVHSLTILLKLISCKSRENLHVYKELTASVYMLQMQRALKSTIAQSDMVTVLRDTGAYGKI